MNPFSFKGTADRFEWWFFSVFGSILAQVAGIFGFLYLGDSDPDGMVAGIGLLVLAAVGLWVPLSVTVRRLRERQRPVWLVVSYLVPYIGWIYLVIECGILGSPVARQRGKVLRSYVTDAARQQVRTTQKHNKP